MRKYLSFLSLVTMLLSFMSCQKEYKAPVSNVVEMSGRWWMERWYDADGDGVLNREEDALLQDYAGSGFDFTTANDALNSKDSLWVVDEHIWPFKGKLPIDLATKAFMPVKDKANLAEGMDGESFTLVNGKILPLAGTTNLGAKIDSIFMTLQFSDDPGETYFYSGIKYTGLSEDNY